MLLDFSSFKRAARRHAPLLIPYLAVLVLVRAWFHPGLIAGEDFSYGLSGWNDSTLLHGYFPWPDMWDPSWGFGFSTDYHLTTLPTLWLAGLVVKLGLGWTTAERLIWLFPLVVLLPLSPYALAMRLTRSPWVSAAAALVFSVNTWVVGLIVRGHIPALVAYSLMPLVLVAGSAALRTHSKRASLALASLLLLQGLYEIRYTYLSLISLVVLLIVEAIAQPKKTLTSNTLRTAGFVAAAFVAGSVYWIVPSTFTALSLPPGFGSPVAYATFNAKMDILHSFALFYPYYHHTLSNDAFFVYPVEWPFIVLGLLVATGLFVGIRRPMVRAVALLWGFGVVYASGSVGFFGGFNQWVFLHVPGMTAFREGAKLFSYINLGAVVGIAVLLSSLPPIQRGPLRAERGVVVVVAAVLFAACYLFAVRGAYDPLYLSNFSTATVRPGDARLQNYLSSAPAGRVLFFPTIPAEYDFDNVHPAVSAALLGSSNWPFGLAPLQPPGSKNTAGVYSFFGFYSSPLVEPLLCETGVRYVALVTDETSSVFEPWQSDVQRAESKQFLDSRPWLQPVDLGLGALPEDRRLELYRVTGCASDPNRLAFVARYPAIFEGDSLYLESLAASPLWKRDPAVIIADEQTTLAPFDAIANVVTAPLVYDSQDPVNDEIGYSQWLGLMTEGSRRVLNQPFAYHGFAFDRSAQANILNLPIPPGLIKETFTSRAGDASIDAFVTPQAARAQQIVRATALDPIAGVPVSTARELVNPNVFDTYPGGGIVASDHDWLQVASSGGDVTIVNPQLAPVTADVTLPGAVALAGPFENYTLSLNGTESWSVALPQFLQSWFGLAVPATMRNVTLMPGSNSLSIRPSEAASASSLASDVSIWDEATVSNVRPLGNAQASVPLMVSQRAAPEGVQLRVSTAQAAENPATARFRMLSGLSIPLSSHPQLRVHYLAPADPLNFDVALGLSGPSGRTEYLINLPRGEHAYTIDAYDLVQKALLAVRRDQRKAHAADYAWLREDAYRPQAEASSYALRYADLLLIKPAATAVVGAAGTYQSISLIAPISAATSPRKRYVARVNFLQRGIPTEVAGENVGIEGVVRTRDALSLTISLRQLSQQSVPYQVHPGDSAMFTLTNGTAIQGVVAALNPNLIVIKVGETYSGIPRNAIATISSISRNARQTISFLVPFDVPAEASHIEFTLAQDPGLVPMVTLLVRDSGGRLSEIFPQDRSLVVGRSEEVPEDWLDREVDPARLAPLSTNVPSTPAEIPVADLPNTFYDLPIHDILASEDPGARDPRVVGVRFAFEAASAGAVGVRGANAQVSGLAATSAQLATAKTGLPAAQPRAALQLDGKAIALAPQGSMAEGSQRGTMAFARTHLAAGTHLLVGGEHDPTVVQWGLVGLGRPAADRPSDVVDRSAGGAYSERYGDLDTDGGVLVMPTTYWRPWRVALAPRSFVPSGIPALDYVRLWPWLQSSQTQVRVNGGLNGWIVPAFHGRVIFIYETAFYLAVGVALELLIIAIAAWMLIANRRRGGAL